jgi:hypothetical protein
LVEEKNNQNQRTKRRRPTSGSHTDQQRTALGTKPTHPAELLPFPHPDELATAPATHHKTPAVVVAGVGWSGSDRAPTEAHGQGCEEQVIRHADMSATKPGLSGAEQWITDLICVTCFIGSGPDGYQRIFANSCHVAPELLP